MVVGCHVVIEVGASFCQDDGKGKNADPCSPGKGFPGDVKAACQKINHPKGQEVGEAEEEEEGGFVLCVVDMVVEASRKVFEEVVPGLELGVGDLRGEKEEEGS